MMTYETIQHETIWVGKLYEGGRISGTWDEIGFIDESAFRDLDIAAEQPEHLRDFYDKYFAQTDYYLIADFYDNVYSKKYRYEYLDLGVTIYANSGSEAEKIAAERGIQDYHGRINCINQETGDIRELLPIKFN